MQTYGQNMQNSLEGQMKQKDGLQRQKEVVGSGEQCTEIHTRLTEKTRRIS